MIIAYFDKSSLNNYKANQALRGIESAVARHKYSLKVFYNLEEIAKFEGQDFKPIIVFCNSENRSLVILDKLYKKRYHPVFVITPFVSVEYPFSCVSVNYQYASYNLTKYIIEKNHRGTAFFGFNSDSTPDKLRLQGYLDAVAEVGVPNRMFFNYGDINSCLEDFWEYIDEYKNIICANDIHAVLLINRMKESGIDYRQYNICGFGNTMISRFNSPTITTVEVDYELAGQYAVELYITLGKMRNVHAITFTIETQIFLRESTNSYIGDGNSYNGLPKISSTEKKDFYDDNCVIELDGLDKMLSLCDETDLKILKGILVGDTYEKICEDAFIAINTVKYRMKKLIAHSSTKNKTELVERIKKYRFNIYEE